MTHQYIKRLPLSWSGTTDASTPDSAFLGKRDGEVVLAFSYLMAPEEPSELLKLKHGSVRLGRHSKRLFEIAAPQPQSAVDLNEWLQAFRLVLTDADHSNRWMGRGRYADALSMIDRNLRGTNDSGSPSRRAASV